ncbi:helix-turn-helix domain-containing protein [Serratia fonticola]|jgi:transcriptional regulator with XRE-family HTH domain|uniref:Helix-turn-helix domain-containing protein n=1 Tax=Serratia fonticola TaxID=47917 RepID=A0AAW3WT95_SERFO|nr:helix-turn-helix domain-containing protein [Serratia fonticola]MBC3213428.1 helix-turn-helix domain-containing protein [Serratia fonticola]NYA14287.1 helix-turn-helix domain-containing protein [Serratia fonticola]NYA33929.1 helix-turn-helix domain-containing protein [Serratia fonticola]
MTLPGERIRARRKELKLTQRALAKIVKVAHVTISQWETGDSEPGGKNLFALSKALQCAPTWILYGDENMLPDEPSELPRQLDDRENELLDLFSSLPESEKEVLLTDLRERVEGFNRLFEELLKARKPQK